MRDRRRAHAHSIRVIVLATIVAAAPAGASAAGLVRVLSTLAPDGTTTTQTIASEGTTVFPIAPDGLGAPRRIDARATRDFIVQFAAPPLARARRLGMSLASSRAPFESFLADLPGLEASVAAARRTALPGAVIRHRLQTSFNGVAITAPPDLLDRIRSLPYVTGVFSDDTVRATLHESVPLIRADSLRALTGLAGEGIVVSIIDTGIDYRHPGLGGCFGPGCRVEAGYDIRNDDPDPMDDHGHGTHVAGIVGGAGEFTGVAPAVHFHAYKVFDALGSGLDSYVILAIDRSMDPDQNPLTDDAVDVINMSLGGPGDADDPLSQAVDEAVAAGVVCVVAAGNGGGYMTIDSPGCARKAITVGATTKLDSIAGFSSRGAAAPDFAIKPDVMAPGQDITSLWPGIGYQGASGTSMATPHVAGTVALMRQLHPGWSPEIIKAALMNTAVPIAGDPLARGAGRIDALAAAAADLAIVPGSLSFGLIRAGAGDTQRQQTLQVVNLGDLTRNITLAVATSPPPGVTITFDPPSVELGPWGTASVLVTLTVDASVPAGNRRPFAYTGDVVVDDGTTPRRVPWAFLKCAQLVLNFDRPGVILLLHDRVSRPAFFYTPELRLRLLLRPGVYDVMALVGDDTRVVREGIVATDSAQANVFHADAVHTMRRITIDEQGNVVHPRNGVEVLMYRGTGFGLLTTTDAPETMRFSSMSDAYTWEWTHYLTEDPTRTYAFHGFRHGIDGSFTFQNAPNDLRHVVSEFSYDPSVDRLSAIHYVTNGPRGLPPNGMIYRLSAFDVFAPPLVPPFAMDSYYMSSPDPTFIFDGWYKDLFRYNGPPIQPSLPILTTPYFATTPGRPPRGFVLGEDATPVYEPPDEHVRGGMGAPTWFGRFVNRTDSLELRAALGNSPWIFLLQGGAWRDHRNLPYRLCPDEEPCEDGVFEGLGHYVGDSLVKRPIVPGHYRVEAGFDRYFVDGLPGLATVAATFDTRAPDKNPPYLTSVNILADGAITDAVRAGTVNEARVRVADDAAVTSFKMSYRIGSDGAWAPLAPILDDGAQRALLPDTTGYVSLRIEAADATGNTLIYTVEPAVHIGSVDSVEEIHGQAEVVGPEVRLTWIVPHQLYETATVYRSDDGETWSALGAPSNDGSSVVSYLDDSAKPDHRYRYRLGLARGGFERFTAVTELVTPPEVLVLAMAGHENPARGGPVVSFTLPDARPASLEVIDIAGRVVLSREVGALGPGHHRLDLSASRAWRPGIYLLRLRNPERSVTRKIALLR